MAIKLPFMRLLCDIRGEKVVLDEDEWAEILDRSEPLYVIGDICDRKRYGDNCCDNYCDLVDHCPAVTHTDKDGNQHHVIPIKIRSEKWN